MYAEVDSSLVTKQYYGSKHATLLHHMICSHDPLKDVLLSVGYVLQQAKGV